MSILKNIKGKMTDLLGYNKLKQDYLKLKEDYTSLIEKTTCGKLSYPYHNLDVVLKAIDGEQQKKFFKMFGPVFKEMGVNRLVDFCLTLNQATYLKNAGLKLYNNTSMIYCDYFDQVHDFELLPNKDGVEYGAFEIIPTLTINEMIEMLPRKITWKDNEYSLVIYPCEIGYVLYYELLGENGEINDRIELRGSTFKGTLFNTLKFLVGENILNK